MFIAFALCHFLFLLQVRLTHVVPYPLGSPAGSPLDQALVGVSLCPPLVVDTHPLCFIKRFFNVNYYIPFCYLLNIKHWCSVLFDKCICFCIYTFILSSYSQPTSCGKILFPMHFYCIQIPYMAIAFLIYSNA